MALNGGQLSDGPLDWVNRRDPVQTSDGPRQLPVLCILEDEDANWRQEHSVFGAGAVRKSAHELNNVVDRAYAAELVKKVSD